eukprot:Phypoly_transcript_22119.p1 GENE.Phypoly_transcript_22119~~Phypoly_transcript_22119.p1  ORF type:complete len:202 (+),score=16.97 Phypoly_transcript_22119:54-608(+)
MEDFNKIDWPQKEILMTNDELKKVLRETIASCTATRRMLCTRELADIHSAVSSQIVRYTLSARINRNEMILLPKFLSENLAFGEARLVNLPFVFDVIYQEARERGNEANVWQRAWRTLAALCEVPYDPKQMQKLVGEASKCHFMVQEICSGTATNHSIMVLNSDGIRLCVLYHLILESFNHVND